MGKYRVLMCLLCGEDFPVDVGYVFPIVHLEEKHGIDGEFVSFVMLFKVVVEVDVDE